MGTTLRNEPSIYGMPLVVRIHGNLSQQYVVVTSLGYIVLTHNSNLVTWFSIKWTFPDLICAVH